MLFRKKKKRIRVKNESSEFLLEGYERKKRLRSLLKDEG